METSSEGNFFSTVQIPIELVTKRFFAKDTILWVRPEETRPKIDWDCPCLDW
jgi:hypothetical protein